MGTWLLEHGELLITLGGALLGLIGTVMSFYLKSILQPYVFRIAQLELEKTRLETQVKEHEVWKNSVHLPDCAAHQLQVERALKAQGDLFTEAMKVAKAEAETSLIRQVGVVAEDNRRFREELGREVRLESKDLSRTVLTEDAARTLVAEEISSLRDRELKDLFARVRDLESRK